MIGRLKVGVLSLLILGIAAARAAQAEDNWETTNQEGIKAFQQGQYADAEKFLTAGLKLAEKPGSDNMNLAKSLNNLGLLYEMQGKYSNAEGLYKRSLANSRKTSGTTAHWSPPRAIILVRSFTSKEICRGRAIV